MGGSEPTLLLRLGFIYKYLTGNSIFVFQLLTVNMVSLIVERELDPGCG